MKRSLQIEIVFFCQLEYNLDEMKRSTKIKFAEITFTILDIITRTPEALTGAFLDSKSINRRLSGEKEFLNDRLIQHLRNLTQRGYIETKIINSSTSVRLTTKGKIKNLENPKNKKTDNRLRIISYDIPEDIRAKRQQLCRSLRRIGFRQLQKSLWVCRYIKADEIDLIIEELELRKYVAYFIIAKSNIDEFISGMLKET